MAETFDAVVIGAGHNGLVAANLLADAGWQVLVLEATDRAGGAVRSQRDSPAPGYTSDVFSAFYPLGAASPVLRGLHLEDFGLEWSHAPLVLAHAFDDGRAALLARDVERTATSLDEFSPGDGETWRRWTRMWAELENDALRLLFRPFPPIRPGMSLVRRLGLRQGLRAARFAVLPIRSLVREEKLGAGAAALLAGNALHTDLTPESAASAVYGVLLCQLGQHHGFPVPRGGADRLVAALEARLASRGGEIRCLSPVRRVLVTEGNATGVELADGKTVRASRAVLADVPAPILFERLLAPDLLPARLRSDLDRFEWGDATVKVDWALSGKIPWTNPDVGDAGTVHLGVDLDGLTRYAGALATRAVPEHPFVVLGQMTTSDPSRSPAGTESAWGYSHVPWHRSWTSADVEPVARRMEEAVERIAPGFRDLVVGRVVRGPHDLEDIDPALVGGSINGGTAAVHQQLVFRPTPGLGRADTFVPGLFLAGSSAHPGGGVHGAAGANAAKAALRRSRVGRPVYDGTVTRLQRHLSS